MRRPAGSHVILGVDLEKAELWGLGEDGVEVLGLEADAGALGRNGARIHLSHDAAPLSPNINASVFAAGQGRVTWVRSSVCALAPREKSPGPVTPGETMRRSKSIMPVEGPPDDPWSRMMRAAIAGDEGVYRRLLEEIARSVRAMARAAFARARLGDADVEDAVQESLLAIHLKRHTWDPGHKLAPWVNAVARHKIIDAMRRRGARRAENIEDFQDVLATPAEEDPHALSDARKLMETLNPRQRDIVQSISLDGQSIAATATRLMMTEVAVRVALHRALKSMGAAWRRSAS